VEQAPIWDWASRNLSAASARLLSPADRVERAVSPWAAFVVLPLFALSATGVALDVDLSASGVRNVIAGVVLGLVVGKPLGIGLTALAAVKAKLAVMPEDTTLWAFFGAAALCGVSDPVGLLMAESAFPHGDFAGAAKIGVLVGSVLAAALGALVLVLSPSAVTPVAVEA
jgi:NhaA family Na+:H+ antiporter